MTIKDIAKIANTSHMTVSRVINNHPNVKQETRERILKVIAECEYTPSTSARALISGENKNIGILIMYDLSQFPSDFLAPVLEGISMTLLEAGYHTSLYFDQIDEKRDLAPIATFHKNTMDGVMVISADSKQAVCRRLSSVELPTVLVNQNYDIPGVNYVASDDFAGAYMATKHLIDRGHTHIAMICGNPKFSTSQERLKGYRQAMLDNHIPLLEENLLVGDFNQDIAYASVKKFLPASPKTTAIFSANDVMALGAYRAIKEIGKSIPEDISVVGYDNQEFCDLVSPPLTSVRKHRRLMGEQAAAVILDRLQGNKGENISLSTNLFVRGSTADIG